MRKLYAPRCSLVAFLGLFVLLTSLASTSNLWAAPSPQAGSVTSVTGAAPEICSTTKEFITALEFIRARNDLAILDKDAQTVALEVAEGCKDSAKRFIKVVALLIHSGIVGKDAVDTALEFAKKTNSDAEAFMAVFKRAYAEDSLDLDARSSFVLAQKLYKNFDGDIEKARQDFEWLLDFCVGQKNLNLPRPQCGEFATRIAKLGTPHSSVAKPYREVYQFLISTQGPNMVAGDALKVAEDVVAKGPGAVDNFIQGYRYGVSQKGLALDVKGAVNFALKLATPPKR